METNLENPKHSVSLMSVLSYLVYRTCLQLAAHRGYSDAIIKLENMKSIDNQYDFDSLMDSVEDDGWNFSDFPSETPYRYNKSFSLVHPTEPRRLMVIFEGHNKNTTINISAIVRNYLHHPEKFNLEIVYVHQQDLKSQAKGVLDSLRQIVSIQDYFDLDLKKNPGEHQMGAQRYEKMTEEESAKLLSELYLQPKLCLKIYDTDPPIKYAGYRKGDLLRIIRTPNIEGCPARETPAYRLVVEKI